MKKYRIVKNIECWLGVEHPTEENTIVTEEEVQELSKAWEKPIEELMDDLEEVTMNKINENTIVKMYDTHKDVAVKDAMHIQYEGETYILLNQATIEYWYTDSNGKEVDRYVASAIRMGDPIETNICTYTERYMVTWELNEDFDPKTAEDESDACDWEKPYEIMPNGEYEFDWE